MFRKLTQVSSDGQDTNLTTYLDRCINTELVQLGVVCQGFQLRAANQFLVFNVVFTKIPDSKNGPLLDDCDKSRKKLQSSVNQSNMSELLNKSTIVFNTCRVRDRKRIRTTTAIVMQATDHTGTNQFPVGGHEG